MATQVKLNYEQISMLLYLVNQEVGRIGEKWGNEEIISKYNKEQLHYQYKEDQNTIELCLRIRALYDLADKDRYGTMEISINECNKLVNYIIPRGKNIYKKEELTDLMDTFIFSVYGLQPIEYKNI